MDRINADGSEKFFDFNNIKLEEEFAGNQSFLYGEGDKISGNGNSWNLSEKNQAEDELSRKETLDLGEKLREYSPVFAEPNWEGFKGDMKETAQKKQVFFMSKAAEVYLLLAFCALIAFWGGKTGIFLRESGINWEKLSEISPFIASAIFGKDKDDFQNSGEKNGKAILAGDKNTDENHSANVSFVNSKAFDRNVQHLNPLKNLNYIIPVGDEIGAELSEWRTVVMNGALKDKVALAPIGKAAVNVKPYLKIGGKLGAVNITTPMATGDFNRDQIVGGVGVRAGVSLGNKWDVETGLDYQKFRYGGVIEESNDLDIVTIPVSARYLIAGERDGLSVSVIGGVASNHVVAGNYEQIRQVSPAFPIADLGSQEASKVMVVRDGTKPRSQFTTVMVGVGVERKIDSLSSVFSNIMYTTTVGGGFGRNFERASGVGIELGVRVSI